MKIEDIKPGMKVWVRWGYGGAVRAVVKSVVGGRVQVSHRPMPYADWVSPSYVLQFRGWTLLAKLRALFRSFFRAPEGA